MNLKLLAQAAAYTKEAYPMAKQHRSFDGARFPSVMAAYDSVRFLAKATACSIVGHKWEDQGYAGPDGGCIDITCTRCGFEAGRVTLY